MLVYRITLQRWAGLLTASGRAARWNSNGHFVLYTAGSRALACLENLVHRGSIGPQELFRVTVIDIPDNLEIETISVEALSAGWTDYLQYAHCQRLGDEWVRQGRSAVLQVPSAIIAEESNFLINPQHPQAARIRVVRTEPFVFDTRLLDKDRPAGA